MYGYIYETTNLVNGKKYIGQKKSEIFLGEKYLGSGKLLLKAIKKYGRTNFKVELLEECDNRDELNEKEIYYIKAVKADISRNYYNISMGGEFNVTRKSVNHPYYGKHRDLDTRNKISNTLKEEFKDPMLRKKISEATKKAMQRPEVKEKMSGKNNCSCKYGSAIKGRIAINNGNSDKFINKNELQKYLNEGWEIGLRKNRVCINNKINNKFVFKNELQKYLNEGWEIGFIRRSDKYEKTKSNDNI